MIFSLRVNTFFVNHLEVPLIFHTLFSPFQETFIWYILFLYRNKNKEKKFEMRCQFFFFFWKLRKTCNWRKKKSQFISYTVNARVGLWNSTREPKFTVLANKAQQGLVQYPESCPLGGISHLTPAWDYSSYIDTVWRRWENNLFYNLSPRFRFHHSILLDYNRNSWIRLKAKIPKFYLCACSLL